MMNAIRTSLLAALFAGLTAFGQGSLTPPGAPAPTMKTLDQVEPRTPIAGGTDAYTISSGGSYYLTANMYRTLTISADNVTVDLMGYTLSPSAGEGVDMPGDQKNIIVRNGIIRGASIGIDARYLRDSNSRFEKLTVSDSSFCGMYIGSDCVVRDCLLIDNDDYGIQSSSDGKLEVRDCRIAATTGDGLYACDDSRIVDNTIVGSGDDGLRLSGSGSYVAGNMVKGNTDNYDIAQGNQLNILLCEAPETIDWPAMVTLAGTLTGESGSSGISINADDVTIDLDGHALIGVSGSWEGITVPVTRRNITIRNGVVREWGHHGVDAGNADNSSLENLKAFTNGWESSFQDGLSIGENGRVSGCQAEANHDDGIYAGSGSTTTDSTARNNGDDGIVASYGCTISDSTACDNGDLGIYASFGSTITDSTARDNGDYGIYANDGSTITDSTAHDNGDNGINAIDGCTITDSTARYNGDNGIRVAYGCTVRRCTAQNNTGDGIQVLSDGTVAASTCDNNGYNGDGAGIHVTYSDNRIEDNNVTDNDRGIDVDDSGNIIVRNTASGNMTDYDIDAGNDTGTIQTSLVGAGAWDNFKF